jgi:hypothetical protein
MRNKEPIIITDQINPPRFIALEYSYLTSAMLWNNKSVSCNSTMSKEFATNWYEIIYVL